MTEKKIFLSDLEEKKKKTTKSVRVFHFFSTETKRAETNLFLCKIRKIVDILFILIKNLRFLILKQNNLPQTHQNIPTILFFQLRISNFYALNKHHSCPSFLQTILQDIYFTNKICVLNYVKKLSFVSQAIQGIKTIEILMDWSVNEYSSNSHIFLIER